MAAESALEQDVIDYMKSTGEIFKRTLEMLAELRSLGAALAGLISHHRLATELSLTAVNVNEQALPRYAATRTEGGRNLDYPDGP